MNSAQIRNVLYEALGSSTMYETNMYACDQLNYIESNQFAVVVNSDDSKHEGMHWLAIYKDRNSSVEFFDSFSLPLEFYSPSIRSFLNDFGTYATCNKRQIQSNFSVTCGHFCLYYLLNRCRGQSMESILSEFSLTNLTANDVKVKQFVETNFHCDS